MKKGILTAAFMFIAVPIIIYAYGYRQATKLPDNNPAAFLNSGKNHTGKTVVCIGDSITHGRVSCDYVKILEKRYTGRDYVFVNAGINSELAWNVVQRIDEIIACDPDYVTILIGTNDAHGSFNKNIAEKQMSMFNLPQKPDINWYRKNLLEIISKLKNGTGARIALLSIPPIGESETYEGYQAAKDFSETIQDVAAKTGVRYLSLNEKMRAFLEINRASENHVPDNSSGLMYRAIFEHTILGNSCDEISRKNGFLLVTDYLHLNERGGEMVANLIGAFIAAD